MTDEQDGDDGAGADDSTQLPDDDEFHASFATPDARAQEARDAAIDALGRIDPDDPGTSTIDVIDGEEKAVSTWAKHAAKAAEDGFPDGVVEAHAGLVANECNHFTKQNVTDLVKDQRDRIRKAKAQSGGGSGPPALDTWVEANLERVVVVETTDATQDTTWRWDFADGTVETSTTKDGITHFSWSHFRDEVYQGLGVNTAQPARKEAEEWRMWLADLIEQRGTERTSFGPRSHAVERVQEWVRDSIAYGNLEDTVERNAVYLDENPNGGNPDELRILSTDIKRICDDCEIEVRGLQQELDARGYTHDDVQGVSEGEYVKGSMIRFWILEPDFATPQAWLEESQTPASQAQQQQSQQSGGTPTPASTTATAANADSDGAQISSIGPDNNDDDQASSSSDDNSEESSDESESSAQNDTDAESDEQPPSGGDD